MNSVIHRFIVHLLALHFVISGVWGTNPEDDLVERSVRKDLTMNNTKQDPDNSKGSEVWSRKIGSNVLSLKPEMFQTFYIFLGISFLLILLILYRMYKLRAHRAERKYGVQGDKAAQELTHLPSAMIDEDESELEDDETLFDINKTRVYVP